MGWIYWDTDTREVKRRTGDYFEGNVNVECV